MSTALLIVIACICLWLITTPRIHTGIVVTIGLGLLACGALAAADEATFNDRTTQLQVWGLVITGWGILWRVLLRPAWLKLSMRWHRAHAFARWWGIERRSVRRSGQR